MRTIQPPTSTHFAGAGTADGLYGRRRYLRGDFSGVGRVRSEWEAHEHAVHADC
jgi:hypothetical protein